jgi:hypothetical protein
VIFRNLPEALKRPAVWYLRVDLIFEEFHSLDKRSFCSDHDHVDGIEILFAVETSGEVGFGVDGGMESSTQRASKSKQIVSASGFHVQERRDDHVNGDLIPEHSEKIGWEVAFCHDETSYGS